MGKLYMRYRTIFAAFPLFVVALVLRRQFRVYDSTGVFISFSEALDSCLRRSIPLTLAGLTVLSLSTGGTTTTSATTGGASAGFWHWRNATAAAAATAASKVDFHRNDLLVGTQDPFFWFMVPLLGLVCVGTCTVLNYATLALTHLLAAALGLLLSFRRGSWVPRSGSGVGSSSGSSSSSSSSSSEDYRRRPASPPGVSVGGGGHFLPSTPRRRMITTAVLLFLVSTWPRRCGRSGRRRRCGPTPTATSTTTATRS
ncbi:hypothetical protein VTK73DRAFT_6511 [Phialemonium thermophilum]|uniref:GPI inositol-deacylase transmembrane domain-containing protein n=1 Tax=Phialemonium thermophilum TaxID=223376 RepID=A0ABR3UZA1_9PEZI